MRFRPSAKRPGGLSRKLVQALAVAVGCTGLVALGNGLAAGNTVPATRAGTGSATISGYTVSSIHYTLNATSPQNIDSVSFSLDAAPVTGSTLRVKLRSTGTTWYACTFVSTAVTCPTTSPQATAATSNQLTVVVSQ